VIGQVSPPPDTARGYASGVADDPWLDEDEQRAWRAFIAAQRVVNTLIERQLQHEAGMPHTYYEILVRLSDAPDGRLRMSELAVATLGSRSRLSHAVTRLETNGWVRREGVADDRRGQFAVITEKGLGVLREAAPGHVRAVREAVFDALTPQEVEYLYEVCARLAAHNGGTYDRDLWEQR
jgi:DNA-binding MarR family transcriptional regulator